MKTICIILAVAGFCLPASAQSEISTVSYLKVDRQAVTNEIAFPEKTIMKAIDEKMVQLGYKGKDSKGFTVYRSVRLPELGNGEYDLYFMAERKSRRNKDNSTVTLMISKGPDNFATTKDDAALFASAKQYLENIVGMITAYDLEMQITEQQDAVNTADKKYNDLIDEGQSLEKKKKNIEKDIENNKKNQESQLADIEKQKQKLETLKAGRKQ
ncbi:MAG: hypothetical protein ABIR78_06990 [Ferruginibacter sp.]